MPQHILVIEDNRDLANVVKMHLQDLSFQVDMAHDGLAGLRMSNSNPYDLVILDLMLPGLDGMSICKRIRQKDIYTPILMLTSKSTELDRVLGLEMGADDYVTKPYSLSELMARVKAIFRRVEALQADPTPAGEVLTAGDLIIDSGRRSVSCKGRSIDLTPKEFDLLKFLASRPGKVYNRSQLLGIIWGYGHSGYDHTVNSHMNRLRAKIEQDPTQPRYILTVWGVGYKFNENPVSSE